MQSSLSYPNETPGRVRRNSLDFAAIFFGLLTVTVVLTVVFWQFWHANRVFTGVRIGGEPVGGMTRLEALNHVNRTLQPYPLPPISLSYDGQRWPLTSLAISSGAVDQANTTTVDLVAAVNRAYLLGRDTSLPKQIQDQILALLIGINVEPSITFNRAQLRHAVSLAAEQIHRPARATQTLNGQSILGQDGVVADVEATMQSLLENLRTDLNSGSAITAPFVVQMISAQTPNEATSSAASIPTTLANADAFEPSTILPSILLQDDSGYSLAIDAATLETLLFSQFPLRLDRERLTALLNDWANKVNVAPRDARLQFNPTTGTVNILQTSLVGRQLDVESTVQAVLQAVEAGMTNAQDAVVRDVIQAPLVMEPIPPAVDMNKIPELGIRELVASGTSYFAGSSLARIRNIEVAASKFEGVVIPPGDLFSFNEVVEDVSAANGFEDSLIIWGDQTAVGVGGGVCQVSTTIFRAAYEAGLPIVERYNHGYVVSWYGEPGLDATIYTPTVDFRFRNDTDAHLLVNPVVDSLNGVITFNLYGTKPNRQVIIADPVVTDIIQPESPVYKVDEELATGEQEQVEWEKEGKTVEVTRTIVENGSSRTDTITSKYQPWQSVILVGPGTLAESEQAGGADAIPPTEEQSDANSAATD